MERTALIKLREWAEKKNRKPLVLRGARQVGKTTLVEQFSADFDNYLYFNLEIETDKDVLEYDVSISELIPLLFGLKNKERKSGRTLIFIDEIQNSPKVVAKLRYFYEQAPNLYIIAAGSLLESLIDSCISFPVGRVEYMAIRPCSFYEFLGAMRKKGLQTIIKNENKSLTVPMHSALLSLFNTYTLIGGMPEVVKEYSEHQDIKALQSIYNTLLIGYRDDVEKYASKGKATDIIRMILTNGWADAGKAVKLGNYGNSNYKSTDIAEAFRTLEKTMLLELCYPTTQTEVPAPIETKRAPKLLWLDTGLVNYAADVQREILMQMDIMSAWRGMIAEHIVAQELLTRTDDVLAKRKFWVRGNDSSAEVDFVIHHNSRVIPIEVKSGHNAHLRSLHSFIDRSPSDIAVRVWTEPFSIDEVKTQTQKHFRLINLPVYLVAEINNILDKM